MKLITRTFLFMTGLVLIQALLAFNFLSLSLTRMSQKDGAETLNQDKIVVHNHFSQFHDLVWQDIIHIENTALLLNASIEDSQKLLPQLTKEIHTENLDYITLTQGNRTEGLNLQNPYGELPLSKLPETPGKWHPSVVILEREEALYITGTIRIEAETEKDSPFLLHLYKELDNDFCKELVYDTVSGIILIRDNTAISGTMDPEYYISRIKGMKKKMSQLNGEHLFFDQFFYNKNYNILITPLKHLGDRTQSVEAVIFSPNLPLKQRMAAIKQQFFLISVLCVFLAVIISLGISKTITRPIQELCSAMGVLKNGSYLQVDPKGRSTEIGQLYTGFNRMADSLKEDAVKQQKYIKEITFLKDYNEQIMDSIQEGIAVIDGQNHLTKMNSAFNKFCNHIESGQNSEPADLPFWNPSLQEKLEKIRKGELNNYNRVSQSYLGRVYDIRLYLLHQGEKSAESSCILMLEDITTKEEIESRMLQAEKLNSISILTAGVAHEINNPLGAIMLNVENLENEISSSEGTESLKWIKSETRRIASIIQNLFHFTGKKEQHGESSAICSWLPELDHYMKYLLKEHPGVRYTRTEDLSDLKCVMPPDELLQILINLLNNAVQAMDKGGEANLEIQYNEKDGIRYLVLKVSDKGPGISQIDQMRIFDPFFTTKPVGSGTGLGLSIVYGLVKRYHGSVKVQSEMGRGSEFTLSLPQE